MLPGKICTFAHSYQLTNCQCKKKHKKSCRVMRSSRNLHKMITFAAVFLLVNEKRVIILIKIK